MAKTTSKKEILIKVVGYSVIAVVLVFLLWQLLLEDSKPEELPLTTNIDIKNKVINDNTPEITEDEVTGSTDFFDKIFVAMKDLKTEMSTISNLANPSLAVVTIYPGMRKEEVAEKLQKKLDWTEDEKNNFLSNKVTGNSSNMEGYLYPDTYVIPKDNDSAELRRIMLNRFSEKVESRYATSTKNIVSLDTTMKIASIIEREAAGKHDRRLISGILWNRLFAGMSLDIDATLQYAKGSEDLGWWPKVVPQDKYIKSPYNTYKNKGLPPTPIAIPSMASVEAALNPKKTSCLFYLHDKWARIHCSKSYKEHVANVDRYY